MRSRETLQPRMGLASYQGLILDMMRIGTFYAKLHTINVNYYYLIIIMILFEASTGVNIRSWI